VHASTNPPFYLTKFGICTTLKESWMHAQPSFWPG
jgi:hypothetical protein